LDFRSPTFRAREDRKKKKGGDGRGRQEMGRD